VDATKLNTFALLSDKKEVHLLKSRGDHLNWEIRKSLLVLEVNMLLEKTLYQVKAYCGTSNQRVIHNNLISWW
jgi:hypothetical protein